jgi:hypothetical protein
MKVHTQLCHNGHPVDGGLVSAAGALYISNHQMEKYPYTSVGQFLDSVAMIFKGSLLVQFWIFLSSKMRDSVPILVLEPMVKLGQL